MVAAVTATPESAHGRHETDGMPRSGEFVIRGGYVLSMDAGIGDLPCGDVHVRGGAIVAVGEHIDEPSAEVIDAADKIVMPGFVETHWHMWGTAMRAFYVAGEPDRGVITLSNRLGPFFTPSDTYRGTRLALADGIASGITTVHEWSDNVRSADYADASLHALVESGVRGRFSYGCSLVPPDVPMDVASIAEINERWFSDPAATNGLLHFGVAMRNVVPGQSARDSITFEIAHRDWGAARELGLPITLHASPAGLVTSLDADGLLGPDVQLCHPTQTTAAEDAIVAERGAAWSMSPVNETGRGPTQHTRFYELSQAGALLGLSASNVSPDFFSAMLFLFQVTMNRHGHETGITYRRMVELATIEGAHSIGLGDVTGSMTPGKRADIILINRLDPNMAPPGDPVTQLLELARPANVDTTIVDGRVLLWRGTLVDVDVEQVVRDARQSAIEVSARAGWPPAS